jgi:hypothetical protein
MRSRMEISFCGKVSFGGSAIHLLRPLLLFERIQRFICCDRYSYLKGFIKGPPIDYRCPLAPGRRARGSACSGETASNGESESNTPRP